MAFIRRAGQAGDEIWIATSSQDALPSQIAEARRYEDRQPSQALPGGLRSPQFSLDDASVFVLAGDSALWMVFIDSGESDRVLPRVERFALIDKGVHRGSFLVSQPETCFTEDLKHACERLMIVKLGTPSTGKRAATDDSGFDEVLARLSQ